MTTAVCGTPSGYNRHRRNGETACEACREAHNQANRISGLARGRAQIRVVQLHRPLYEQYYLQEKRRLEKSPP